eukprot:3012678-Pyramimonas_sp.AAC.1
MSTTTSSSATLGRQLPCRRPPRRRRPRRDRRRRARARVSQVAGVRAEERTAPPGTRTSGAGASAIPGTTLESGEVDGEGDGAQWNLYDKVDTGPHYFVERVHRAGNVGLLRPSAPWQPPSSGKVLFGVRSGRCTYAQARRVWGRGGSTNPAAGG